MTNVALTGLARDLEQRAEDGRPVRIGMIGCGEMGTDIVTQVARMKGIEVAAIADTRPERAARAIEIAGRAAESAVEATTSGAIADAIRAGKTALCGDSLMVAQNDLVDVVIDQRPEDEIQTALECLRAMADRRDLAAPAPIVPAIYLRENLPPAAEASQFGDPVHE